MSDVEDLVPALAMLPRRDYVALIKKVDEERRKQEAGRVIDEPTPGMTKRDFAVWMAHQHYAIDHGITMIVYLPTGAGQLEVRLLEVNELANLPDDGPIEAFDFMPDIAGLNYSLGVADVTPAQYDAISENRLALPQGWNLAGAEEIAPIGT